MSENQVITVFIISFQERGHVTFVEILNHPLTSILRLHGIYPLRENLLLEVVIIQLGSNRKRLETLASVLVENPFTGFCLLVDSTNLRSLYESQAILKYLTLLNAVPHIVVANKQDHEDVLTVEQVRCQMELSDETVILPCVATERSSVVHVLNTLLHMIRPDLNHVIS